MDNKKDLNKVADDLIDDISNGINKFVAGAFELMTEIFKHKTKKMVAEKNKGARDDTKTK